MAQAVKVQSPTAQPVSQARKRKGSPWTGLWAVVAKEWPTIFPVCACRFWKC